MAAVYVHIQTAHLGMQIFGATNLTVHVCQHNAVDVGTNLAVDRQLAQRATTSE
jgi:hypothetical protein